MAEQTQTNDMRKLATASNPLQVITNPIVVATSFGVLGAYLARSAAFRQRRDIFGWADRHQGRIRYWRVGPDGRPLVGQEHPNAYTNRILFNLAGVVLGTVLINNQLIEDATADYLGLGVAAGSFANLVLIITGLE